MTEKRKKGHSADKLLTKPSLDEATTQSETHSQTKYADIVHIPPDPFPPNVKAAGQPTKYDPAFNQIALNCAAAGKTQRGIAAHLGVSTQTLYNWRDTYPEFFDTLRRCDELFADYQEYKMNITMVEAHNGLKINNGGWKMFMCRYDEYQTKNNNSLDLSGLPDDFGPPKSS